MAPKDRGMSTYQDQQNLNIMSSLGEIKGTLTTFLSQFKEHEAKDNENARQFDARLERNERRADSRGVDFLNIIEKRFEELGTRVENKVEKLDGRLTGQIKELDAKVDGVTSKQTFQGGAWFVIALIATGLMSAAALGLDAYAIVHGYGPHP